MLTHMNLKWVAWHLGSRSEPRRRAKRAVVASIDKILFSLVLGAKIGLTRKSNPFHRFFNELTPVCLQCVPAQNFSPLVNFTDFQLNNLHYYLSLCWWLRPSFDFSLS